jgi:hypothetical protein
MASRSHEINAVEMVGGGVVGIEFDGAAESFLWFFQSSVQFQYKDASQHVVTVNQAMPDAKIVIDPSVTVASTTFDTIDNVWMRRFRSTWMTQHFSLACRGSFPPEEFLGTLNL